MTNTRVKMMVFQRHVKSFFGGRKPTLGDKVKIAEGISLRLEKSERWSMNGRRAVGGKIPPPEILDFAVFIAKDVALPIALSVLSNWIYDKLKRDKAFAVTINGVRVEGNLEKIKEILEESLREIPLRQKFIKSQKEKSRRKSAR